MESSWMGCILAFATTATVTAVMLFVLAGQSDLGLRIWRTSNPRICDSSIPFKKKLFEKRSERQKVSNKEINEADTEELKAVKLLYYQLHNLEEFPDVLPKARKVLLSLLKETTAIAHTLPDHESIMAIKSFSRNALEEFLRRRNSDIGMEWEQYNVRRKHGGKRELFGDRKEAIWWLKQISPVKYVDGAWLGYIGKVTTPFALRKTIKGAWQILSEELGDGDLGKNHVHVYHKLLENLAPDLPTAEVRDFGHSRHGLNELSVWKSGLAQLLISLFPHEFLPEILGFNLHFEAISMETLKAGKELKEVGIDPYYFILHISIDNAHSGHSAIAIEVVCEYMEYIARTGGDGAVQQAWRKLQAGYLLSMGMPGKITCPSRMSSTTKNDGNRLSPTELEVIRIFKAKARVTHGIHCSSKVRIGSRSVADWLDPKALESRKWQRGLLDALSCSKYWIRKGDSSKSRFMQELQWNGRMFGSFTQDEYDILRQWVDNMPNISETLQGPITASDFESEDDILSGYPVVQPLSDTGYWNSCLSSLEPVSKFSFRSLPSLDIRDGSVIFENFLPLWLAHPGLLQGFVAVPWRTKNIVSCTIVKILRAQGGFDIEQECVAGMNEFQRPNSLGLVGIGMSMMEQYGLSLAALPSLKHVLRAWPSEFAVQMLRISMRPLEYKGLLLGMATAFAKMHDLIATSQLILLSPQDQDTLQKIAQRELEGLELCWQEIEHDDRSYAACCQGYLVASREISKCF